MGMIDNLIILQITIRFSLHRDYTEKYFDLNTVSPNILINDLKLQLSTPYQRLK